MKPTSLKKSENKADELFEKWLQGIPYEIAFWQSFYGNKGKIAELNLWSKYNTEADLDEFDMQKFVALHEETFGFDARIYDVGCALSYMLGNIIGGRDYPIHYVDVLADFYNELLDKSDTDRPRITFGMTECLTACIAPSAADFIHIRNSLDHCADPVEGIRQALACVRVGGVVYTNHFENEAKREAYRGFHQYNITERDGHLVIWGNQGEICDINEIFAPYADIRAVRTPEGRIVGILTKQKDFADIDDILRDTAQRIGRNNMRIVRYFHSAGHDLHYQWIRLYTTFGHRAMRLLPGKWLRRVKKLLSK